MRPHLSLSVFSLCPHLAHGFQEREVLFIPHLFKAGFVSPQLLISAPAPEPSHGVHLLTACSVLGPCVSSPPQVADQHPGEPGHLLPWCLGNSCHPLCPRLRAAVSDSLSSVPHFTFVMAYSLPTCPWPHREGDISTRVTPDAGSEMIPNIYLRNE